MMSLLDYANDVNISIDEVKKLCDKLSIKYDSDDYMLSDTEITLLDNLLSTSDEENDESEEESLEEEIEDKALDLAESTHIDLDSNTSFEKVKSRTKREKEARNSNFRAQRKKIYKHRDNLISNENKLDDNVVLYKDGMTVEELANSLQDSTVNVIKKLIALGVMASKNDSVDFDTAEVIATDYNKVLKKEETQDISNFENYEIEDDSKDLVERPPIVTIMGHVDHGKTTLLDYIRKSSVAEKEAGGITQAIGAYTASYNGKKITFIDTPGHEAFTEMRARGAAVTDIVIIIVAADDGVMPQTEEAIDHAKAANVPIIVAINKIDKPEANVDKVMEQLAAHDLTPEEWGGNTIVNKISAHTGEGVNDLLDSILLVAEMKEYKANPKRYATGVVLESRQDKHVGSIASLIIQNGTLRLGDPIVVGTKYGKVRTLKNDLGENIVEAPPSTPVEVTGLSSLPSAGDKFMAFETEKQAKEIAEERELRAKKNVNTKKSLTLEDLFGNIKEGLKEINIVLKADVNGSAEACRNSLLKINVEGVKLSIIRAGVGAITESDIVLAEASNAIVIGFNVRASSKVEAFAKEHGVQIKTYDIIYKLVEAVEHAMKGMLDKTYSEKLTGKLEVRKIFKFSKVGLIAGCHVKEGVVKNNSNAKIIRDNVVVYNGKIKSLQHEKDSVKEVKKDMDCGLTLDACNDYKEGDIIEVYDLVENEI